MKTDQKYYLTGVVAFAILLVFSLLMYKERTVFVDISLHLFEIIRTGKYAIQNYRFGAFFTQSFPLFASHMGLPLKTVMMAYSAGFVVYYFSIFHICAKVFKKINYALLLLFMCVFMVADTFYWIQSELPQGLAFFVLTMAYMDSRKDFRIISSEGVLLAIMLVFLVFFHPLILIPFVFFVGYKFLSESVGNKKIWLAASAFFILMTAVKSLVFKTPYDSQSMGGVKNFISYFPNYIDLQSNRDFLQYLWQDYYLLPLAMIVVGWFYISRKKWLELLWVLAFFFGYLALVNISYPNGGEQFYMENLYLPLAIFLLVPLVFEVVNTRTHAHTHTHTHTQRTFLFISLVLAIRLIHIFYEGKEYTARLDWHRSLMEKTENMADKKLVIKQENVPLDTLMMTWGSSYEFWLLSTIEKGETRSIVIHNDVSQIQWAMSQTDGFLTNWGIYPYRDLPEKYFKFSDHSAYVFYPK